MKNSDEPKLEISIIWNLDILKIFKGNQRNFQNGIFTFRYLSSWYGTRRQEEEKTKRNLHATATPFGWLNQTQRLGSFFFVLFLPFEEKQKRMERAHFPHAWNLKPDFSFFQHRERERERKKKKTQKTNTFDTQK